VYGSDGCNRYVGTYTSTGIEFDMGQHTILTKKACTEPAMRLAEAFAAALRTANGLLLAAELAGGRDAKAVYTELLGRGLVTNPVTATALRLAPPITVSEAEIDEALAVMAEVLS
jgi:acetylornithine/succinyldiaminopimelate/putrescine aminotransferase